MTEQEASVIRCCGPEGCGAVNGVDHILDSQGNYVSVAPMRWCIGSSCMAWRWDREGWSMKFDVSGPVFARTTADAHGFCGIAGRP